MRYNPDRARCSLWRYAQTDPPLDPWPLARTFPSILENLAGLGQAGGNLGGQVQLAQQGRVQTGLVESGQVEFESSRVEFG